MANYSELLTRLDECHGIMLTNYEQSADAIRTLISDKEHLKTLWHLAEARIKEEREACAKICDEYGATWAKKAWNNKTDEGIAACEGASSAGYELAIAIRARQS